jgi:hypothetical protein
VLRESHKHHAPKNRKYELRLKKKLQKMKDAENDEEKGELKQQQQIARGEERDMCTINCVNKGGGERER